MTPARVKSLVDDLNEIRNLLKPVVKEGYSMESAESMLEEEKHNMIRNFIISSHLLSELFMTLKMEDYFVRDSKEDKFKREVVKALLNKLSFKEKVEISFKATLIPNDANKYLLGLNKLRNYCAHTWVPGNEDVELIYDGKDIIYVENFKIFFKRTNEVLYGEFAII